MVAVAASSGWVVSTVPLPNRPRDPGRALPSTGDNVNDPIDPESRRPIPTDWSRRHLFKDVLNSSALIDGGFADLHHPGTGPRSVEHHRPCPVRADDRMIGESLRFMESVAEASVGQINRVDFFTSHEALLLQYESALTRPVPHRDGHWNLSTHMPWVGVRTADLEGAHIEYLRGIRNPIGVKVGPSTDPPC